LRPDGSKVKHYYVAESVGIAVGILITALHHAGLATLTHTPSPMAFLTRILNRPAHERPYLLVVTGYPAEDAQTPVITKKSIEEIASFIPSGCCNRKGLFCVVRSVWRTPPHPSASKLAGPNHGACDRFIYNSLNMAIIGIIRGSIHTKA